MTTSTPEEAASLIDTKIAGLGDWRGKMLARVRALIKESTPKSSSR